MKMTTRLIALSMALSAFFAPSLKLEAYGYQPDAGGYAYVDSGYSISSSPLIPIAAVTAAVVIGVIIYSGNSHHHHGH